MAFAVVRIFAANVLRSVGKVSGLRLHFKSNHAGLVTPTVIGIRCSDVCFCFSGTFENMRAEPQAIQHDTSAEHAVVLCNTDEVRFYSDRG